MWEKTLVAFGPNAGRSGPLPQTTVCKGIIEVDSSSSGAHNLRVHQAILHEIDTAFIAIRCGRSASRCLLSTVLRTSDLDVPRAARNSNIHVSSNDLRLSIPRSAQEPAIASLRIFGLKLARSSVSYMAAVATLLGWQIPSCLL